MNEQQSEIVKTLADCNMSIKKTAETLCCCRNTINYHIGKIKEKTGLNPMNFYDLIKLVDLVKRTAGKE